jgi:nucleotide-binding universal stress UspA family protein
MYKHILIPTDGSPLSNKAVEHGAALAAALGARVTLLTVTEPFHVFALDPVMVSDTPDAYRKDMETKASRILSHAEAIAKEKGVAVGTRHVEDAHPYESIIATAVNENCDAIVMASHGRRGASALFIGSETMRVLGSSAIPVVVVR